MKKAISSFFLIAGLHSSLVFNQVLPGNFRHILSMDIFLFLLFTVGILVMFLGFKKDSQHFAGRFFTITIFQLVFTFCYMLSLIILKIPEFMKIGLSGVVVFVLLLIIQSIALVTAVNRKY